MYKNKDGISTPVVVVEVVVVNKNGKEVIA
jgi:hypothetical protein